MKATHLISLLTVLSLTALNVLAAEKEQGWDPDTKFPPLPPAEAIKTIEVPKAEHGVVRGLLTNRNFLLLVLYFTLLPLPLFLYNMPALTKVAIESETVRRAMDEPRIIGLKDSSCSMIYLYRILALLPHRPDWPVLVGPEEMLGDAVLAGAHGGVNGGANLFPRLYVKLFAASRAGDLARVRELHAVVMRVSEGLYRIGRHSSAIIKGIKCGLSLAGLCDNAMAEPFARFREPERTRVRAVLEELQPNITNLCKQTDSF